MSLSLYLDSNEKSLVSANNILSITFDGLFGGAIDRQLFIRNDNMNYWYSDISVSVQDSVSPGIVDNSRPGWFWKLSNKDIPLTVEEWAIISPGISLSFQDNIGSSSLSDTSTYLGFWIRVEIPKNQRVQTIKTVSLVIEAKENLISG